MEFMDEQILKVRKQMDEQIKINYSEETIKKELEQSIYDGNIEINGIPVQFSEREILDGKAVIWMPTDFALMTKEEIERQYPLGNRPQVVYYNSYLPLTVVLNHTVNEIPDQHIQEMAAFAKRMLDRCGPKTKFFLDENFMSGSHHISVLNFTSATLTSIIFNKMFVISLEGRVLIGNINFDNKFSKRYEKLATEIVHSVKIINDEEDK